MTSFSSFFLFYGPQLQSFGSLSLLTSVSSPAAVGTSCQPKSSKIPLYSTCSTPNNRHSEHSEAKAMPILLREQISDLSGGQKLDSNELMLLHLCDSNTSVMKTISQGLFQHYTQLTKNTKQKQKYQLSLVDTCLVSFTMSQGPTPDMCPSLQKGRCQLKNYCVFLFEVVCSIKNGC